MHFGENLSDGVGWPYGALPIGDVQEYPSNVWGNFCLRGQVPARPVVSDRSAVSSAGRRQQQRTTTSAASTAIDNRQRRVDETNGSHNNTDMTNEVGKVPRSVRPLVLLSLFA